MLVQRVAVSRRQCRWRGSGRRRGGKKKKRHFVKLRLEETTPRCTEAHVMLLAHRSMWCPIFFFFFTRKWFVHCRTNVFQPGEGWEKMIIWDHTGHFFFFPAVTDRRLLWAVRQRNPVGVSPCLCPCLTLLLSCLLSVLLLVYAREYW